MALGNHNGGYCHNMICITTWWFLTRPNYFPSSGPCQPQFCPKHAHQGLLDNKQEKIFQTVFLQVWSLCLFSLWSQEKKNVSLSPGKEKCLPANRRSESMTSGVFWRIQRTFLKVQRRRELLRNFQKERQQTRKEENIRTLRTSKRTRSLDKIASL